MLILRIIVHLYLQIVNVVETKLIMFTMLSPIKFIRCFLKKGRSYDLGSNIDATLKLLQNQ